MKKRVLSIYCAVSLGVLSSQPAHAIRHKRWTPAATATTIHDGVPTPQQAHGDGANLLFVNGKTGVTTQAQGVTLKGYQPGFNKKTEVQATINKGVTYSATFAWYQQYKGSSVSNAPNLSEDTQGNWYWDTGTGHPAGPYGGARSKNVDSSRTVYLWDAPGVQTSGFNSAAPSYYDNSQFSYRDSLKFISPSNVSRDLIPGYWMPSWSQSLKLGKDAGATVWYATQNN